MKTYKSLVFALISVCITITLSAQNSASNQVYARYSMGEINKTARNELETWGASPLMLLSTLEDGTKFLTSYQLDSGLVDLHSGYHQNLSKNRANSWLQYAETFDLQKGRMTWEGIQVKNKKEVPFSGTAKLPSKQSIIYKLYGFDLANHLKSRNFPKDSFKLKFVDLLNNFHDVLVKYERSEVVNGITCERYRIIGQGALAQVGNNHGTIWLGSGENDPALVRFDMNVRLNWTQGNLSVNLVESKQMSWEEWQKKGEAL